jgi:hypothetical protein
MCMCGRYRLQLTTLPSYVSQAEADGSLDSSEMLASLDTVARLTKEVQSGEYGLLIHNGDISYAR